MTLREVGPVWKTRPASNGMRRRRESWSFDQPLPSFRGTLTRSATGRGLMPRRSCGKSATIVASRHRLLTRQLRPFRLFLLVVDDTRRRFYGSTTTAMAEILVVDDSKVMREMLIACLRGQDSLAFTQASSGLEAIEQLSLRHFDLVLLDMNMPDIGGIEVVEFIRSQDRLSTMPIIVVTTRGDEVSKDRALKAGATRYLTKPFTPELIQLEVGSALGLAKASR